MAGRRTIVGLGEALWDVLPGGRVLGGAPLNVVCHVQALFQDAQAVVASRVGTDALGDDVVRELALRGMATDFVQRDAAHATSTVNVELEECQPTYSFAPDIAWDHLQFTPEWAELAARCHAVCFGTLAQRSTLSRQAIWQFLDAAPQAIRLFDVNLRQGFYDRESIVEGLRRATLVKLNEAELPIVAEMLHLAPAPAPDQLRQMIDQLGMEAAVFTRGERGTLFVLAGAIIDPPVANYPAAAGADAVGAGDACSAGVLVGWLRGLPIERIAELANHLGAYVASQPGATPALPSEIRRMALLR
jgi:fructokinase